MDWVSVAVGFATLAIIYKIYRRYNGISLSDVAGPESPSFIMGNTKELYQGQAAEADFKWQAQYGDVVRFKGLFGEDQLIISDPAALNYIFVKAGYRFPKSHDRRAISNMLNGKGLTWADGEDHKRHRKVLSPGFGAPESKALLPLFQGCAESMSQKWMDLITNYKGESAVLNIAAWLSRAALDAIGEGAFDIRFGSLDSNGSPLARAYSNMLTDVFGSPSNGQIVFQEVSRHIPFRILEYLMETSKSPRMQRVREVAVLATSLAKDMVKDKVELLLQGKSNRDVFSLLVKANIDTDAKAKLTEEELYAQMRVILFAGHETTSKTISWALLELARHPEMQSRLRAEIRETEAVIHARGDTEFTITDLDNMPYATAFIKEVLRFYPVVYQAYRCATQDEVLPLSQPITTRSGKVIRELPVPKGTQIVASIAAYNRIKDLWGEDAHVFNPERWLNDGTATEKKATSVGVYANLLSFLGGVKSCIGWRFAMIELQTFITEAVGKFEFALTDKCERIRREPSVLMTPMVEGEFEKGVQVPLRVSVASRTVTEY
ncbi:cytochrome P450 [Rhizopogon vinicolor AM-OR11-026]|uniref:Cytochrome P450 n=1 Tax=Rhizopogon vinicolor AM-OR11-026 TaxID=1314800 RepID=A0A1B7MTR1_9AGAM|nr:cytochrome P450 [Rhizopogon vinicolor AM-OR11-026]